MSGRVLVDVIAGARPNFMKISSIIRAIRARQAQGSKLHYRLVHTGQHYDARMSGEFFEQLEIPTPDINLEVGSGTQAEQTAAIMVRYEQLLASAPSSLCMVVGDVNSTMACAIAGQKLHVPVAHVEAGIRSGDWTMPEEINRMVTDAITNFFFTTSAAANENLRRSGVSDDRIFFVGNTMIDTLLTNMARLRRPAFWEERGLCTGQYIVMTLHRPSNVDDVHAFSRLLHEVCTGVRNFPVVFPVHPRTAKTLEQLPRLPQNLIVVSPQPYLEFNFLVKNAFCVVTDSGGITEETTVLKIPCITLRDTTERPETVTLGTNELVGTDPAVLPAVFGKLFSRTWKVGAIPEKWDGKAGERIARVLDELALRGRILPSP